MNHNVKLGKANITSKIYNDGLINFINTCIFVNMFDHKWKLTRLNF